VNVKDVLLPDQLQALGEFAAKKARGRPKNPDRKKDIKLRIDPDVLKAFRATGKGWQTKMNNVLRRWMEERV